MSEHPELRRLCESCCDLEWHLDPVEGAAAGVTAHDARLGAFGAESVREHVAALRALEAAVEALEVSTLEDEIDRTALLNHLRVALHRWAVERPHHRDPGLWVRHVLEGLQQPLLLTQRSPAERRAGVTGRLRALPAVLGEAESTLETCPRILTESALASLQFGSALVTDAVAAVDDGAGREDLSGPAEAARAAVSAFAGYLESALKAPGPPEPWGVGADGLTFRLRHEHALAATREDLLQYAARLIEETERTLTDLAAQLGDRRWQDTVGRIEADALPAEAVVAVHREEYERAREHVLAQRLATVPEGALTVRRTPAYAEPWLPVAAYVPPAPLLADRSGQLLVTAGDGRGQRGRAAVAAAIAHETIPGHHLHFLAAQAQPRTVRRMLFSPVTFEGWALYAEGLMDETGFYRDAAERFYRALALLRRALRVPLDIGIHTGALGCESAVTFVMERMVLPRAHAVAEVSRTYAWPGVQLSYAAGYREILRLRDAFAGGGTAPAAFHDAVLACGGLPPSLIRWGLERDG